LTDFLKVLIKVLPPLLSIATTIIVAIGDLDDVSYTAEDYNPESSEWPGI